MAKKIKAAVLHRPLDLRVEKVDMPVAGPDDVLVKMRVVGVCGSDVHYWQTGRIGPYVVERPMILGHECAGEVVEVGKNVKHLQLGDRVALEPGIPCRKCFFCRSGRYNLCPDVRFLATPPVDGALVEYLAHPADFAFCLRENVTYEEGSLLEPLSVGIYAVRRANLGLGAHVLISGAGPIGLVTLLAARAAGTTKIYMTDVRDDRLNLARQMGATEVINVAEEDVGEKVDELTDGVGVDAVIECSGAPAASSGSLLWVRRGGTVVLVGMGPDEFNFPVLTIGAKELDVKGVFRYVNTYPAAVELVANGAVNLKPLVIHGYPLDQVVEAMDVAHKGTGGVIKVAVTVG
jgi:L-iditol 2-dehydrogenase